jgi:succinoglycan biosynthesis protein ExoM
MHKVTIGIPTYKRPAMLEKLLQSIFSCRVDPSLVSKVDIVIVDNDAEKTAESTVVRLLNDCPPLFQMHYCDFPIKGLSNVRNEIINKAIEKDPDFILFVDDDEYVVEDWLTAHVSTIVRNRGDFAMGPVIPEFEKKVSADIAQWFGHYTFEDQRSLDFMDSGNLIMRTKFIKETELRFDPRFNTLGAEDSYFGVSALKKGASIFFAKGAIAYETIPEKRATLAWLYKRRFRGANTYTYIILLEKKYFQVLKKILVNFVYLLVGVLSLVLVPIHFNYRYFGVLKLAESLGGFAGLFNIRFHEYLKGR